MIRLSIRRPVAVAMVYASVALLGVAAWRGIPVELLPSTEFPRLNVAISWPGASPETVEAFATSPVEASIQQIGGVEELSSTSRENGASIEIRFTRETDMDFARLELSERIANLEEELPPGVQPLRVSTWIPQEFRRQAERPFLAYTLTGPFLLEALRAHLEDVVEPEILQIRGVSEIVIEGARNRLLEVELDPDRIAALGLRPEDVQNALLGLDLVREAGSVRQGDQEWAMTIRSRPATALDIRQALLTVPGGGAGATLVRVEDVGVIRDTFEEPRAHFRINGMPTVRFTVQKEAGVNTVRLAEAVKTRMNELERSNPPGSELILVDDQSEDINREITDLRTRAGFAAVVIFLVLLGFLRSFRTAGIVFATIAFSILITLNLIYFGGLTLNLLTLMGLALGFGLIVDNSIVVLENIYRRWQEGDAPERAAEKGARDVILPILASTATTLIVLVPFVYLRGELRIMYLPLAIVVGLTLVASIFVAFTFIPALAARLLGHRGPKRPAALASTGTVPVPPPAEPGVHGEPRAPADPLLALPAYRDRTPPLYIRFYAGLLEATLRFPWATVAVAAVCFAASWWVFDNNVSRGQIWAGGFGQQRSFVQIFIDMPRGSDLERLDDLSRHFEERLARMPEIEKFTANVMDTRASIRVDFPVEMEYTAVPLVIEEEIRAYAVTFTGANVRVIGQGPSFGSGGGGGAAPNYTITFLGYNYDRLAEIAEDFGRRIEGNARVHEVDTNASAGFFVRDRATEFVAHIDRESAARLGITVREATDLVRSSLRGTGPQGSVVLGEEPVRFEVKLAGYRQADVQDLKETVVATSGGNQIRLGDLVQVEERRVLTQIRRENQQYERSVAYEFRGPRPLGDIVRDEQVALTILPPGYSIRERSPWRVPEDQARQFTFLLLVSIGLIFMVTAGLFESVRQPLAVLLAVPMALIGVFLTFYFVGAVFTREAYIGVIMMGGIVVNNAILLVDHINRVRLESEADLAAAILRGTLERVRPILMTTATTVLGLLPLVLFTQSADSTIWNALTYSLIGGLLSSTIFVLTTTPALYLIFERMGRAPDEVQAPAVVPPPKPAPPGSGTLQPVGPG
ncbi:MAG: efflux RND transporter permease subunit [Gemmatimonadales bacterium]|nr:MAG: efflux RND transporter permease subunit [Gemmatimonadales bacterium]